jgi:type IV secretion system protein VirB10
MERLRSNYVILGIMTLVAVVVGVIFFTVEQKSETEQKTGPAKKAQFDVKPSAAKPGWLKEAPDRGVIAANAATTGAPDGGAPVLEEAGPVTGEVKTGQQASPPGRVSGGLAVSGGSAGSAGPTASSRNVYASDWSEYRRRKADAARAQYEADLNARDAGLGSQSPASPTAANSQLNPLQGLLGGQSPTSVQSPEAATATTADDANGQGAKRAFLAGARNGPGSDYLLAEREAARSPYELKAGSVIPAVLVGGINSDLPGEILGQVTRNVYDTATGAHLLIPQGSKLVGTYDSAVTHGQSRVLVAWTRIIYPDASSLDIGAMPGVDRSGYAGYHDQVNNHFAQVFGSAMLVSLFSAAAQLSQPQATNGQNISASQTIAASMGQQMGQVGSEVVRRGLNIQPTLVIRPGYRMDILTTKDMIIRPWR